MGIKDEKSAVRAEMSAFRIRPAERAAASVAICERLRAREEFCSADTVLLYAPLPDELDVLPLMSDGKRFCFPRYQADRVYAAAWVCGRRLRRVVLFLSARRRYGRSPRMPLRLRPV